MVGQQESKYDVDWVLLDRWVRMGAVRLTRREQEYAALRAMGFSLYTIADALGITVTSVQYKQRAVYKKYRDALMMAESR